KTLAGLKRGEVELAALDLSMRGEATTSQAYRRVKTALAKQRPSGVTLVQQDIRLPLARPYTWHARKAGDGFTLEGYAPGDEARGRLVARARALFGKMSFSERTDIAGGAPEGWEKAIAIALEQLAQLKSGDVVFSG